MTMLPLKYCGQMVALHMGLDLYLCSIVGYAVDTSPSTPTAVKMFTSIIADARRRGDTAKTVHADNGWTMKSKTLTEFFSDHGIQRSHSRPHVSDDNAHMESSFATLKGDLMYPGGV